MTIGIIQITSKFTDKNYHRLECLKNKIIPTCINIVGPSNYTLVSPENAELQEVVESLGATFVLYTGWEKDKSRKFREGMLTTAQEWIVFLDDDILPDPEWLDNSMKFLQTASPGQYGFRLTDENDQRHVHGEDWMQFPSRKYGLNHRGLNYDIETGYIETSPTAYVANSFVHRDVVQKVQPFGIFGKAPDVNWSFAIKEAGYPVGFILKARAYHLGDRSDNR